MIPLFAQPTFHSLVVIIPAEYEVYIAHPILYSSACAQYSCHKISTGVIWNCYELSISQMEMDTFALFNVNLFSHYHLHYIHQTDFEKRGESLIRTMKCSPFAKAWVHPQFLVGYVFLVVYIQIFQGLSIEQNRLCLNISRSFKCPKCSPVVYLIGYYLRSVRLLFCIARIHFKG